MIIIQPVIRPGVFSDRAQIKPHGVPLKPQAIRALLRQAPDSQLLKLSKKKTQTTSAGRQ